MKPCVVGIGGAGGNILKQFLQSQDLNLLIHQFGDLRAFGDVKGVWLESATQDAQGQRYYGSLIVGHYPPYLICHEGIGDSSPTRDFVMDKYGFDLKAPGFDRRAEYLKALFEVFDIDTQLKETCSGEFVSPDNPLSGYMWRTGIRPFTIISVGKSAENTNGAKSKPQVGNSGSLLSISNVTEMIHLGGNKGAQSSKLCDSILFLASLGGGTGTGFINPITSFVRSEESIFPIFALGILTEKGDDKRHAKEGQRYLAAVIAMYDLLTKESRESIDGLILMDNQILKQRFKGNYLAMDSYIYSALKPILDTRNYPGDQLQDDAPAIRRVFWELDEEIVPEYSNSDDSENNKDDNKDDIKGDKSGKRLLPPILVPCYHAQPDNVGDLNTLVMGALGKAERIADLGKDGRLFPSDPAKADRAIVFTRGFFSIKEVMTAVQKRIDLPNGKIKIYRKLGDSKNEDMLILLRNPFGGTPGEHEKEGTLEWRFHDIITKSLDYINQNEENILGFQGYKDAARGPLRSYFYGKDGLRDELIRSRERLERGDKQIFSKPLYIFKGATASIIDAQDPCKVGPATIGMDEAKLREMVREEVMRILMSEDHRTRIKEIMK